MMALGPGGMAPAAVGAPAAEAVVEEEPEEILMEGEVEYLSGKKWKKRYAQLAMSNSTGGELRIFRRAPKKNLPPPEEMTAKQRKDSRPQVRVAVNTVRLSEAEAAMGCEDHKNCAEFARKLNLKLPGPQCEVNAKTLYGPSPDMLLSELCPRSCDECPRLSFSVADSLKSGEGEHSVTAPSPDALRDWSEALREIVRRFGNVDQSLTSKSEGQKLSPKYPALTSTYESANVPGLYFAGTVAHGPDWRQAAGGFIHGFRYTAKALSRILDTKLDQVLWPSQKMGVEPTEVVEVRKSSKTNEI